MANSNKQCTLHGVFLDINDLGVLITGISCIGKSELALGLIERGHRLIADDSIIISKSDANELVGVCPSTLQDFLEVRGLGILNIRALFGDQAICPHKKLDLMINIFHSDPENLASINRITGIHQNEIILDVTIPHVSLPLSVGRNVTVLVECIVRNHLLKSKGYIASDDFIHRQRQSLINDRKTS